MPRKKHINPVEDDLDILACASSDKQELMANLEERDRLVKACADKIAICFIEIRNQIGPYEARGMLEELLRSSLAELPQQNRDQPLTEREQKYLDDVDAAPQREKKKVISDFADERGIKVDSAKRELNRYRKDIGYQFKKWAEKSRKD